MTNESIFHVIQVVMLYPIYFCFIGYCFMRFTKICSSSFCIWGSYVHSNLNCTDIAVHVQQWRYNLNLHPNLSLLKFSVSEISEWFPNILFRNVYLHVSFMAVPISWNMLVHIPKSSTIRELGYYCFVSASNFAALGARILRMENAGTTCTSSRRFRGLFEASLC